MKNNIIIDSEIESLKKRKEYLKKEISRISKLPKPKRFKTGVSRWAKCIGYLSEARSIEKMLNHLGIDELKTGGWVNESK